MPIFSLKKMLSNLFSSASGNAPIQQSFSNSNSHLSKQKQKELADLYYQILNNKDLVTSGKMQLLGLDQVKEKMGKKWTNLSSFVFETVEKVIKNHISKTDLYFCYRDASYLIIFYEASTEEAQTTLALITEEIRRQLFTLDEDQLKKIHIKNTVQRIKSKSFLETEFPKIDENKNLNELAPQKNGIKLKSLIPTDINADPYKAISSIKIEDIVNDLEYMYLPIWEVKRAALTTYVCFPKIDHATKGMLFTYSNHETLQQKLTLDLKVLTNVIFELMEMHQDGRKLYIGCPVHYDTLYNVESFEVYKAACEKITKFNTELLIFIVMAPVDILVPKDPYWFVNPLKPYCDDIFVEVHIKHDTPYQLLKNSGIETIGIRLSNSRLSEQQSVTISNNFSSKAKYFKILKTFAFDVSTLSATTSLICAGFDYIGGPAIHEEVEKPNAIHRYRYEDLLSELINPTIQIAG